jgi:hypothetical protein
MNKTVSLLSQFACWRMCHRYGLEIRVFLSLDGLYGLMWRWFEVHTIVPNAKSKKIQPRVWITYDYVSCYNDDNMDSCLPSLWMTATHSFPHAYTALTIIHKTPFTQQAMLRFVVASKHYIQGPFGKHLNYCTSRRSVTLVVADDVFNIILLSFVIGRRFSFDQWQCSIATDFLYFSAEPHENPNLKLW